MLGRDLGPKRIKGLLWLRSEVQWKQKMDSLYKPDAGKIHQNAHSSMVTMFYSGSIALLISFIFTISFGYLGRISQES